MKKKNNTHSYSSYQEYLDFCLPGSNSEETQQCENSNVFGKELASESIKIAKNVLSKKK